MFNDATQVVLMRDGTRTVLSMQNNYKGPLEDFAMVVPVPVVLHEGDVKTLPKDVFEHVDALGAPRLVEYWEQDPCRAEPTTPTIAMAAAGADGGDGRRRRRRRRRRLGVKIEAKFDVGEYQIVILSAKDSTGLDTWLRDEHYKIPAGAEPLLRPYVEGGIEVLRREGRSEEGRSSTTATPRCRRCASTTTATSSRCRSGSGSRTRAASRT